MKSMDAVETNHCPDLTTSWVSACKEKAPHKQSWRCTGSIGRPQTRETDAWLPLVVPPSRKHRLKSTRSPTSAPNAPLQPLQPWCNSSTFAPGYRDCAQTGRHVWTFGWMSWKLSPPTKLDFPKQSTILLQYHSIANAI